MKDLEERLGWCEKMVEKLIHEDQMVSGITIKLLDSLERRWNLEEDWRRQIRTMISLYRGEMGVLDRQQQEHFKVHTDKKTKDTYIIK